MRSRDAPDDPFRSGPRAFTIIHVNCPQHARSCPKSHAPWLHFAAGQTFRTVSESVLRRTSARESNGALSSPHGNANLLCVRGLRFFCIRAHFVGSRRIFAILTDVYGVRRYYGFASVECNAINKNEKRSNGREKLENEFNLIPLR